MSGVYRSSLNWVNNVMTWDLSADNTNLTTLTAASLGSYVSGAKDIYRCPADRALSMIQRAAGWNARIRSYSMNVMIGDAGRYSTNGYNINNPDYTQFFKITRFHSLRKFFVFLDELPDSINDGYFVERDDYSNGMTCPRHITTTPRHFPLPTDTAPCIAGCKSSTIRPPMPDAANLPIAINADERADFDWVMDHMSVKQN